MAQQIVSTASESWQALDQALTDVAGQLAPRSQRVYGNDARHFVTWLAANGLTPDTLTHSALIQYRRHLAEDIQGNGKVYAKATAQRMLITACRLADEATRRGLLAGNITDGIKGFKGVGGDETPYTAITRQQARAMLDSIDRSTRRGKRDAALVSLLIRTGIRRSEAAALTLGDFSQQQGHHILTIQKGKGARRRATKVQPDVLRSISEYLESCNLKQAPKDTPIFVQIRRGDHPTMLSLSDQSIEDVVRRAGAAIGVDISPHSLRSSFITIALESGASLHAVQFAAGHQSPVTTEHYAKRKTNYADHATDYIKF